MAKHVGGVRPCTCTGRRARRTSSHTSRWPCTPAPQITERVHARHTMAVPTVHGLQACMR
jgi:hypothetical protein